MRNNIIPFALGICIMLLGAATNTQQPVIQYVGHTPKQVYVNMLSIRSSDNVIREMYTKGWILKSMVYNPNYIDRNTSGVGAVLIVMEKY